MKKIVNSNLAPEPIGPYSQAVIHGGTLYVSGQIAIDRKSGELVTGDINKETELVMQNIEYILTEAGYNFSNVVKCTIFVKSMDDFAAINSIYGKKFTENPPARETVEVSKLPKNVNVEISCIAVK